MGRYKEGNGPSRSGTAKAALTAIAIVACLIAAQAVPFKIHAAEIVVIDVKDAISPPIASFITENIDRAASSGKLAIIIRLDTPGGLDTAMRDIIQKELNADIPVVVYVSPQGARAASAGAIITLAADVAAMAPGTNIGAAHPVNVGVGSGQDKPEDKTMVQKVTNDAVAYARSIARERGRNEKWAEEAVTKSISTPAFEALQMRVVDIIAKDTGDLLRQIDGRSIRKKGKTYKLETENVKIVEEAMGLEDRILAALSNPNIAYILMLIGLAGIFFELSSPGAILPGVIGGISLILAFFAFQTLPVNFAGIALIILAVILFLAEIKVQSFGMLTVGGLISMVLGSVILFRNQEIYEQVSFGIILPVTLFFAAVFVILLYMVVRTQRQGALSGAQSLIGQKAEVYAWSEEGTGKVFCHGEYWNARGPGELKPGNKVEISAVHDLELIVREISER